MAKVVIMDHPLIQHKIGYIRRIETGTKDFRQTISEIAMLICYEATRSLPLADVQITTPICDTTVKELKGKKMAIVPILRAGLGMVDGVLNLIPAAKSGISACIVIRKRWNPWNITASFPQTVRTERFSLWIPCWLQAVLP